uniref:C-type lectin domain-containing protein n=1 Tax=Takifugu rubripes TaxID=31033 RepID=A0A3B5KFZ8_TAKRU
MVTLDLILRAVKSHLSFIETKSFLLLVETMSWDAAQELCSQRGGDLASISDELQHSMIYNMTNDMNVSFWIGLRDDVNSWRWSLNTSSHFVLRWEQSEPDNANSSEHCASISDIGSWRDRDCSVQMPFFCDDGMIRMMLMGWSEALAHCRTLYTDLSAVLLSTTNQILADELKDRHLQEAWIGLYRDSWKWVDSTTSSFRPWAPNEPDNKNNAEGVLVNLEKSWSEALAHCRTLYTDLSAVLLSTTNQILADKLKDRHLQEAWIGLYRDSWKWVDSTTSSFGPWAPNEPDNKNNAEGCVAMSGEHWYDRTCNLEMSVLCQRTYS